VPFKGHLAPPSPGEAAAASNAEAVLRMVTGHWTAQIVRAAAELRLADGLAAGARTAEEIAGLEGSDADTTYRLMCACAALGLLTRETGRRFSLTPLGQLLRADVAGSLRPAALIQGAEGHWGRWMLLPEAVGKDATARSWPSGSACPTTSTTRRGRRAHRTRRRRPVRPTSSSTT
jgi:hypothetical protein